MDESGIDPVDYLPSPLTPGSTVFRQTGGKCLVAVINQIAEEVDVAVTPESHRQLHSGNDLHAESFTGLQGLIDAIYRIVVSYGDCPHTFLRSHPNQFGRGVETVGIAGMEVQVNVFFHVFLNILNRLLSDLIINDRCTPYNRNRQNATVSVAMLTSIL